MGGALGGWDVRLEVGLEREGQSPSLPLLLLVLLYLHYLLYLPALVLLYACCSADVLYLINFFSFVNP